MAGNEGAEGCLVMWRQTEYASVTSFCVVPVDPTGDNLGIIFSSSQGAKDLELESLRR